VKTTQTLTGAAVAGAHVTLRTATNPTSGAFSAGQSVGEITAAGLISGTSSTPVVTDAPSGEPSLKWRVFHS
jgi:hypothetical protein